jgi:hypothetical protein
MRCATSAWTALPWTEACASGANACVCLRAWMPELGLPDLSDAALLATLDDLAEAGLRRQDPARCAATEANWPKR